MLYVNFNYEIQWEKRENMTKSEKGYINFQFKIPNKLYNKFRIKSIEDNSPTYRDKIIELIEEYVRT